MLEIFFFNGDNKVLVLMVYIETETGWLAKEILINEKEYLISYRVLFLPCNVFLGLESITYNIICL